MNFEEFFFKKKVRNDSFVFFHEKNQENDEFATLNSELLSNLLTKLLGEAQTLKNKLKMVKGLPLDQEFIPDTSHNCPFCPRKFDKPCSLGGHISKVHYKESRKMKT